jgi:WS/DGAT/MGAT family acyltransferase
VIGVKAKTERRLSALDGSFLRLESDCSHTHVGFSAVLAAPDEGDRPTLQALRDRVSARLDGVGWCQWKLRRTRLGLVEPSWVDDRRFDLAAHVQALSGPDEAMSYRAFAAACDAQLSEPMDRGRAMWQIFLVPRLEDGRVGMLVKIHHALVDGIAALQIVSLVVDEPPDGRSDSRIRSLPAAPASEVRAARGVIRGARQVGAAVRADVLPRAPRSILNVPIGPRRVLVGHRVPEPQLRAARSAGGTVNDIGLAVVAGALRALSVQRGEVPEAPFKAMIPVSLRRPGEGGPGNRIAMVYIKLPVDLPRPRQRLEAVRAQTQQLKGSPRAENMEAIYAAGGLLPGPMRSPIAKAMASRRVFNVTITNPPGPRGGLSMLGCELEEVYTAVPITQGHALGIGMVRFRHELFIGCQADPDALPEVTQLPALLAAEVDALDGRRLASASVAPVALGHGGRR